MANTQRAPYGEPQPVDAAPTKRDLASWWKQFKKTSRREEEKAQLPPPTGIFGVPLAVSIQYAHVAISLFDENGRSFIYGYVPIIVAKCGVFLKEKATDIEGIFRLAGAERRIKELQAIFNSPDRYGKGLDWTGYTVHDAANVLRRYLNQLPEPIVPLNFYQRFRDPLRDHQGQAVGATDLAEADVGDFDVAATINTYKTLITELPPLNRQLLLYILDLVAVFASKSEINRMTASNLAAIFQPGLLSHPDHDMSPSEYRLSQNVVIFLIQQQDNFLVGMQGTAADERTIQEVQAGASPQRPPESPSTPNKTTQSVGRSASTASAGTESMRKYGGVRRNVSVSSRQSRQSAHSPGPTTPPGPGAFSTAGKSSGVHRSNTVPAKKIQSPKLGSGRISREINREPGTPISVAPATPITPTVVAPVAEAQAEDSVAAQTSAPASAVAAVQAQASAVDASHLRPVPIAVQGRSPSPELLSRSREGSAELSAANASGTNTPTKERSFSGLFNKPQAGELRKTNKLQKRRTLGGNASAHSSNHSVTALEQTAAQLPAKDTGVATDAQLSIPPTAGADVRPLLSESTVPEESNADTVPEPAAHASEVKAESGAVIGKALPVAIAAQPTLVEVQPPGPVAETTALKDLPQRASGITITPRKTSGGSAKSVSSANETSEADVTDEHETSEEKKEKKRRWRLSRADRRNDSKANNTLSVQSIGMTRSAERSASSVGSTGHGRLSATEGAGLGSDDNSAKPRGGSFMSSDGETGSASQGQSPEKKGPIGWFRGKLQERKERAKSPPPAASSETAESRQSLAATMESANEPPVAQPALAAPVPVVAPVTPVAPIAPEASVAPATALNANPISPGPVPAASAPVSIPEEPKEAVAEPVKLDMSELHH